jgi:tetratricopeptide (TPR) repeat protein
MTVAPNLMRPQPRPIEELLQQAFLRHHAGALSEARNIYRELLRTDPLHFDANHMLGLLEAQDQQFSLSLKLLCRTLALRPDHIPSHWHLGEAFIQMEFYEAAIACFRRSRAVSPAYLEAWVREANLLEVLNLVDEAMWAYTHALLLDPLSAGVQFSAGNTLKRASRFDAAIDHYRKSLVIAPDQFDVYINLGNALKELNRLDGAVASHGYASRLKPTSPLPPFNQSLILLLQGRFAQGWPRFETRWDVVLQAEKREFRKPRWTGRESLLGRTIFVYPEQGLGDTIQFCRYLPVLSSKGARVIFEAPPELRDVLKTLPGAITLLQPGFPAPEFDFQIPLLSIPGALRTTLATIPAKTPYLKAPKETVGFWRARVNETERRRVGLVWSGGTVYRNDHNRSLSLSDMAPILNLPFEFHCLQKVLREGDLEELSNFSSLAFHGDNLHDFSDTAALIEAMDLVITVDTSVAHLAGALGKPVWILLPFAPDFRWLLDRKDSPWYPSARLFRQREIGQWSSVIEGAREALLESFPLCGI